MNRSRPVFLNLFQIKFPITAIVSILHRISGFVLFLLIPLALWALSYSLTADGFAAMQEWMNCFFVKFFIWLCMLPLCYHLAAGIRHLLMDVGLGVTREGGRLSAYITFGVTILLIIMAGIWIW